MKQIVANRSPEGSPPLTFPDILSDPLIRAVMAADHVDPQMLKADLGQIARMLPAPASTDRNSGCGKVC
jgi:hypothetical protein